VPKIAYATSRKRVFPTSKLDARLGKAGYIVTSVGLNGIAPWHPSLSWSAQYEYGLNRVQVWTRH
jgi:hypothetical protein